MWAALSAQAPLVEDPLPAEVETPSPDPGFVRFENPAFPTPPQPVAPAAPGPRLERADLAPYFAEGKLKDARKAFDEGRYDAARALLDGAEETAPVRYLRAVAALRAHDDAFASEELERLAATWSPMKDRCLVQAGWSYEVLKNDEAAQRVFAQVPKDSRVYGDARLGLARVKKNLKQWKEALAALEDLAKLPPPLWGRDLGAEALAAVADVHAAKGDKKKMRAALIELWSLHPLTHQAQRAEGLLGELSELPTEVLVTRGDTLIDAHRNAQGVELIEPLLDGLKLPAPLACRAHFAVGKGYRKLRRHVRAIQVLSPVVAKCKDPDLRARALYTMGFSQFFVAPAQSALTYATVARDYPEHSFADDGLFFSADSSLRLGNVDQAVQQLIALVDGYPDGDYAAEALFKLFWIARQSGQSDDALMFLQEIEARTATREESADLERARYWRGRVLEEQGKADDAQALWLSVAQEHPASYYGLISRERLEAASSPLLDQLKADESQTAAVDPFPLELGPLGDDPQFQRAVELLRLGFGELVPGEVLGIDRTRLPPESVRVLVHLMALAGEVRPAHGLARLWLRRDLAGRLTPQSRPIWEIAYPKAFRDLVLQHSQEADELDPDLLQALMREESALDPKALSWAGALGLCQLMPPTAAEVAAKLKLKQPSQAALLEPDLNLKLGAKYLSDLVTHQKGVLQFAIASYNAGEGAVGRWRKDTPGAALDEWVEQIPVQETRGYVKRVLRSYVTYKLLYAPTELAKTLSVPKASKAMHNTSQGRRGGSSVAGEGKDPAHH